MSRPARLVLLLLGAALFTFLVHQSGGDQLLASARKTGWVIIPIVLLYAVVVLCEAQAWRLIIGSEPTGPGYLQLLALHVSGTAFNFLTPMVNAGGEPYKVAVLSRWLGGTRATGAALLAAMVRALGNVLLWLTALALGLVLLPRTVPVIVLLGAGLVVAFGLLLLILTGHRSGFLERLLTAGHRLPVLRRLARRLEPHRGSLASVDRHLISFYHQRPRQFAAAVAFQYLGRVVFVGELYLVGVAVGPAIGYFDAYVTTGLEGLVGNLLFFVPFQLGTREGATILILKQLGYPAALGLFAAMVNRFRDLSWIAIGILIWLVGFRRSIPAARPTQGASPA